MDMKRALALLLCLCLAVSLLAGCGGSIGQYEEDADASAADAEPPAEDATASDAEDAGAAEPTAEPDPGLGYAAFAPDEVVAVCGGEDVTWREYYYWLNTYVSYMQSLSSMGMPFSGWDSSDFSAEMDNASLIRANAAQSLRQYRAVEALAKANGLALTQEDEAQLQTLFERYADASGDGDGTCTQEEADAYTELLDGQFVDRALFDYMNGISLLADKLFDHLYGADGADYPDADVLSYAQEQGILACKHILLMTMDTATGESLPEEQLTEKKQLADDLYAQLSAVADDQQALTALFDQLMQANSEDTGLAANPGGYQFAPGTMVAEFEDATAALEEYGLSEPIQSSYGWHIILRLPIDPDGTLSGSGSTATLRATAADAALAQQVQQQAQSVELTWNGDFENVDVAAVFGSLGA